jgi:hypothetical protein
VILLISDLLDLPAHALGAFAGLGTSGRALLVLQVLDPAEARLDFEGNVRLRALEGDAVVEADADAVREEYLARLGAIAETWSAELTARGGRLLRSTTGDPATEVARAVVQAVGEVRR